jgi:hypothetical protein
MTIREFLESTFYLVNLSACILCFMFPNLSFRREIFSSGLLLKMLVTSWQGGKVIQNKKSLIVYERFFTITKTRAFPIDVGE